MGVATGHNDNHYGTAKPCFDHDTNVNRLDRTWNTPKLTDLSMVNHHFSLKKVPLNMGIIHVQTQIS